MGAQQPMGGNAMRSSSKFAHAGGSSIWTSFMTRSTTSRTCFSGKGQAQSSGELRLRQSFGPEVQGHGLEYGPDHEKQRRYDQ